MESLTKVVEHLEFKTLKDKSREMDETQWWVVSILPST